MERKALSGIILILLLTGMLTTVINTSPILADTRSAELSDRSSTIQKTDTVNQNASANENPSHSSVDKDRWNFTRANEWADFAKVDWD